MSKFSFTRIAMFVLAAFVANFCIAFVQSDRLHHEIEHALRHIPMSFASYDIHVASDPADRHDLAGSIKHQLFHAADHVQSFPLSYVNSVMPVLTNTFVLDFAFLEIPATPSEAPFRPPRFPLLATLIR